MIPRQQQAGEVWHDIRALRILVRHRRKGRAHARDAHFALPALGQPAAQLYDRVSAIPCVPIRLRRSEVRLRRRGKPRIDQRDAFGPRPGRNQRVAVGEPRLRRPIQLERGSCTGDHRAALHRQIVAGPAFDRRPDRRISPVDQHLDPDRRVDDRRQQGTRRLGPMVVQIVQQRDLDVA